MSLNSFIKYKKNFLNDSFSLAIRSLINSNTPFEETNSFVESLINTPYKDFFDLFYITSLSSQDQILFEVFSQNKLNTYNIIFILDYLAEELHKEYNVYSSYKEKKINYLNSLNKRLAQKVSSLEIKNGYDYLYSFREDFINSDYLENSTKGQTSNSFFVLPIASSSFISPQSISIGNKSQGSFGSSDADNPNENNLSLLLNGKQIQWEQLTNNGCSLSLGITFDDTVVNYIEIYFEPVASVNSCMLNSVISNSNNEQKTLVSSIKLEAGLNKIYFYPIKTNYLEVNLQQNNFYVFKNGNNSVKRKVISLSSIKIGKNKFNRTGKLLSKGIDLPSGLYSATAKVNVIDSNENLYTLSGRFSLDDKKNFYDINTIVSSLDMNKLYYELSIERNDDAFENNISINSNEQVFDIFSQTQYLSPFKSPGNILLDKKSIDNNFIVYLPNVFRVGDIFDSYEIGRGIGAKLQLRLKEELNLKDIQKAILSVDGEKWTYVESLTAATATDKYWTISKDNYRDIIFGDDTNGASPVSGSVIKFSIAPEKATVSKGESGYYLYINNDFDPDIEHIKAVSIGENSTLSKVIVEKNTKSFKLPYKNIVENSCSFKEKMLTGADSGTKVFLTLKTFVNGYDELTTAGHYSIDYKNGYIYSYTQTPLDTIITCSFSYYPTQELNSKTFSIVYDKTPIGIFLKPNDLPVFSVTDYVNPTSTNLYELTSDGLIALTKAAPKINDFSFPLSRNGTIKGTVNASNLFNNTTVVVEELEYIDGYSEFLGLIKVENEVISSYTGTGVYSFTLFSGSSFYAPLSITFSDTTVFATEKSSAALVLAPGDYYISESGVVSVYVDTALATGIYCSYYYRNNDFDYTNKYSIDYKNNILYSLTQFKSGGYITYKVANIYLSYNKIKILDNYDFDSNNNLLTIKTDKILTNSDLVKVSYPIKNKTESLEEYKEYYSPLIDSIDFGFR